MELSTLNDLFESHNAFFIDAYGVLVTSAGPMPGAKKFIDRLNSEKLEYFILTNDASRLPETAAAFYASYGLAIPVERVISAGMAIEEALIQEGLKSPSTAVLGTKESHEIVRRTGARILPITAESEFEAVVVADDSGFDVLPTLNDLLSSIYRQIKRTGQSPALLLPNADILYPRGVDAFGFTSGSIARLLELGLERLMPDQRLKFKPLGKPETLLYEMALKRAGCSKQTAVMIGDQLTTDILGANRAGIASALIAGGITPYPLPRGLAPELLPTYILTSL